MCTAKNAAKVSALRHNPAVALTVDTEVHPPKILLIRGRAELDVVEGIPAEGLHTKVTAEASRNAGHRDADSGPARHGLSACVQRRELRLCG